MEDPDGQGVWRLGRTQVTVRLNCHINEGMIPKRRFWYRHEHMRVSMSYRFPKPILMRTHIYDYHCMCA